MSDDLKAQCGPITAEDIQVALRVALEKTGIEPGERWTITEQLVEHIGEHLWAALRRTGP